MKILTTAEVDEVLADAENQLQDMEPGMVRRKLCKLRHDMLQSIQPRRDKMRPAEEVCEVEKK